MPFRVILVPACGFQTSLAWTPVSSDLPTSLPVKLFRAQPLFCFSWKTETLANSLSVIAVEP